MLTPRSAFSVRAMVGVVCVGAVAVAALAIPTAQKSAGRTPTQSAFGSREPLQAEAFVPLPLGAIRPAGWLRRQLQVQADGLTGHLDEFWPDLGPNSGWLGGSGESWERGPYFVDGLVPLAYLLNDEALDREGASVDGMDAHASGPDGRIGPVKNTDWWPNMVMLKALTQYQEATGDARVIPAHATVLRVSPAERDERPLESGRSSLGRRARQRALALQPHWR